MIDLPEIIRQLATQGEAIRALAQTFTDEQAAWKPDPDTWSLKDVMQHLYNEERLDFRRHLKGMFGEPQPPDQRLAVESRPPGAGGLIAERQASLA